MSWAVWTGVVLLAVAVGGLHYLRDRPLRDDDGHPVVERDDDGRVIWRVRLVRAVLTELLDADHAPRTACALRRRLRMPVNVFYQLTGDMVRAGLLRMATVDVDESTTVVNELFWTYRLTDEGLLEAMRRPTNG